MHTLTRTRFAREVNSRIRSLRFVFVRDSFMARSHFVPGRGHEENTNKFSCVRHDRGTNEERRATLQIQYGVWMSGNKLKLSPDTTEFLLIGHEQQRSKYLAMFPVDLLGLQITSAKAARNLCVIFDTNFSFRAHVSAVCRSCRYHTRDLRRIHHYLSFHSAKLLAHALVSSRLVYCNSLLLGIADKEIIKLQRIQNPLARVVTKKTPLTHSVPLLRSLHWLPVKFRIEFKTCLLTYKTFSENQPDY